MVDFRPIIFIATIFLVGHSFSRMRTRLHRTPSTKNIQMALHVSCRSSRPVRNVHNLGRILAIPNRKRLSSLTTDYKFKF